MIITKKGKLKNVKVTRNVFENKKLKSEEEEI